MTEEEKEKARRRVTPMLMLMLSAGKLNLAVKDLSLLVVKGEFKPDEVLEALDDAVDVLMAALAKDRERVAHMLCCEALGSHTLHDRERWEAKIKERKILARRKARRDAENAMG